MAKSNITFGDRFPFAGLFLVIAVALAIPLTVWSLNNVSTQTLQRAAGCSSAPSWSSLIGHTDYPTSVKYQYKITNSCGSSAYFNFSASRPTTGWSYQYSGCNINTVCTKYISGLSYIYVYVTISRPSNASSGTYYITLKSALSGNTSFYSTKTISYIVINSTATPTPTPKPLATPTPAPYYPTPTPY